MCRRAASSRTRRSSAGPTASRRPTILDQVTDANRYPFDQAAGSSRQGRGRARHRVPPRINFMPNAVYKPERCIRTTLEAARALDFPIERIIFEATEGEGVNDGRHLRDPARLPAHGFMTAIDDFGAGYAGLNLLADFQPDVVKLDMALVRGVDTNCRVRRSWRGVLGMCRGSGSGPRRGRRDGRRAATSCATGVDADAGLPVRAAGVRGASVPRPHLGLRAPPHRHGVTFRHTPLQIAVARTRGCARAFHSWRILCALRRAALSATS